MFVGVIFVLLGGRRPLVGRQLGLEPQWRLQIWRQCRMIRSSLLGGVINGRLTTYVK